MHKEEREDLEALAASERVGHETRDLPPFAFGTGMLWFTGLFVAALIASWLFLLVMPGEHTSPQPIVPGAMPPKPWLQNSVTAKTDIQDLRTKEAKETTTFGYVDQGKGVVRIPIAVAIDQVARQGLPVQGQSKTSAPQTPAPEGAQL